MSYEKKETKVSIPLNDETLDLISKYQKSYRELKGVVISRGKVIDRVFEMSKTDIESKISKMQNALKQKQEF